MMGHPLVVIMMAGRDRLRKQLEELRAEMRSLKEAQEKAGRQNPPESADAKQQAQDTSGPELQAADETFDLEQSLKDLADIGEKEIAANPIPAVAVAFFLGLVVGRLSRV